MQSDQNESVGLWDNIVELPELKAALTQLNAKEQRAIFLRFWDSNSIDEIANDINLSWGETDALITETLKKLRALLPKNCQLKFSRPAA
jgi:DNA-directed RNA polymerase specialized sigma24 family protein